MARPRKESLDYFPFDCVDDISIKLIEAKYGLEGFGITIKLFQKIFGSKGYYCVWNEDALTLLSKETDMEEKTIQNILTDGIKREIFDRELFEKYSILTSASIQKIYVEAVHQRDKVNLNEDYLLVEKSTLPKYIYVNGVNINGNSISDNESTQSKVKESKVNENKEKESKLNEMRENNSKGEESKKRISPTPPTIDEVASYAEEKRYVFTNVRKFHDYYTNKGWPVNDWRIVLEEWAIRDEEEYNRKCEEEVKNDHEWQSYLRTLRSK